MVANFAKAHARIIRNLYYVPLLFSTAYSASSEIKEKTVSQLKTATVCIS